MAAHSRVERAYLLVAAAGEHNVVGVQLDEGGGADQCGLGEVRHANRLPDPAGYALPSLWALPHRAQCT